MGIGPVAGGGGGISGGGMMRTVGRMMRTGINGVLQDSVPSSTSSTSPTRKSTTKTNQKSTASKHALTLSSTCHSPPVFAAWPPPSCLSAVDCEFDDEWECVENYSDDHVFGPVPSEHEVEHAIFSLQQVIAPVSPLLSTTGEAPSDLVNDAAEDSDVLDWIEPSKQIYDQSVARSRGWERVYDAFHLLQTEPSVQRMVISLSSDKAVWDAVLNNEAVREIRESYCNVVETNDSSDENSDPSDTNPNVLKWMFDNMKVKLLEVIEIITQFVGKILKPLDPNETSTFSEKLMSTFLLTVVVLLIVVVARGHEA